MSELLDNCPNGSCTNDRDLKGFASEYIAAGFAICRLKPGEKQPRATGWPTKSAKADEFQPDDSIGLVCGWPSNGGKPGAFLVCVDLDTAEANEKADEFLPTTGAIEGRAGKPRSHRWYLVTDIPDWATSKAKQPVEAALAVGNHPGPAKRGFTHAVTGERIIDFQGSGGQAVVPPSIHHSGEQRRWEPGCSISQIATVPFCELWDAVCQLAEAAGAKTEPVKKIKAEEIKETKTMKTAELKTNPADPVDTAGQIQGICTRQCDVPMEDRVKRCQAYLKNVDPARSGFGGHDATYRAARLIVNDFAVSDMAKALPLLQGFNTRTQKAGEEPWTEAELEHKVEDALAAPVDQDYPFGCKLAEKKESWGDPSSLASSFVDGGTTLYFSGRFFRYNGKHYDEIDLSTLKAQVWSFIEIEAKRHDPEHPPRVSRALRDGVVAAIEARGVARIAGNPQELVFNAWLPGNGQMGDVLVMRNGLLDVATGKLLPHTPDFLGLYCLPYDHDPTATCPIWEKAVSRICGGDAELVRLLQQWYGYCLTSSTDHQKFLVLVGEGANGKSTLVGGLLALLGAENATHVALERFSGSFDLGYTLGKLVNVPDDMAEIDKANEGVLKTYTSGGAMAFNQKNKPILFARPTAKLMFCTNTVPRFSDRSSGLWRRLLLVPLTFVIPEGERVPGMDKPGHWDRLGETAGMLNWALAGLTSLRESGGFVIPACVRKAVADHQVESNPTRLFLTEHVQAAEQAEAIPSSLLYAAYRRWMTTNGHNPLAHMQYTKEALRVFTGATRTTKRNDEGKTERVIAGLRWTEEGSHWATQA